MKLLIVLLIIGFTIRYLYKKYQNEELERLKIIYELTDDDSINLKIADCEKSIRDLSKSNVPTEEWDAKIEYYNTIITNLKKLKQQQTN